MKTLGFAAAICLACLAVSPSPALAQEDYSFITNAYGPQVCIGRWIPPTEIGRTGVCEGQLIGLPQLTALSSKQSADRLEQLIAVLSSIDQKMDINNEQLNRLIEATVNIQTSIDRQITQESEFLRKTIARAVDKLPADFLANKVFMEEINRLKRDILREVERRYPGLNPPPK
jgi:hypothetical protein